jgi:hypothetical protein
MLAEYAPGPSASHRPRIARHANPSAMRLRSEEELKGGLDHALKEHSAGDAGRRLGPFLSAMALASRCGRAHGSTSAGPRLQRRSPSDIHSSNAPIGKVTLDPRRFQVFSSTSHLTALTPAPRPAPFIEDRGAVLPRRVGWQPRRQEPRFVPIWADTVEKLRRGAVERNFGIRRARLLNQTCAPGLSPESMLRRIWWE